MHTRNLAAMAALATLIAGCGSSSTTTTSAGSNAGASASTGAATASPATAQAKSGSNTVKVSAAEVSGLGKVLVDAQGHTLYMFTPDAHSKVTCTSSCALIWPPLKLAGSQRAQATGEVRQSLLGKVADPEGASVITYAGWPLYSFASDSSAGTATGQGLNSYGGTWYAISPAGKVIR